MFRPTGAALSKCSALIVPKMVPLVCAYAEISPANEHFPSPQPNMAKPLIIEPVHPITPARVNIKTSGKPARARH